VIRKKTESFAADVIKTSKLHRPSNKGTKLLLKVIKAIIIIITFCEAHPLQVMPFLTSIFFLDTLSCFASVVEES